MLGGDDDRRRFNRPGRFDEPDRLPWMEAVEDQESQGMGKGQKRFLLIIAALLVVALFASLLFYAYDRGRQEALDSSETTIIMASEGPAKVQPADRGGLSVPDQDRLVFNSLNSSANSSAQEEQTFSDPPEQPVDRPTSNATTVAESTETVSTAPVLNDPTTAAPDPVVTQTTPPADARSSVIAFDAYRIQLGAFGSNRSAEIAWGDFQNRFPFHLGRLNLEVEPLNRANSPSLYRLRAGPFSSRARADETCQALRDLGQGCFVISP